MNSTSCAPTRRKKSWRGLEIDLALVLFTYRITLTTMPFAWNLPLFSFDKSAGICGELDWKVHAYFGPFHIWTMQSGCTQFAIELEFGHCPFWRERPTKRKKV